MGAGFAHQLGAAVLGKSDVLLQNRGIRENGSCPEYSLLSRSTCSSAEILEKSEPEGGQAARDVFVAIAYFIYIFCIRSGPMRAASFPKYHTTGLPGGRCQGMIVVPVGERVLRPVPFEQACIHLPGPIRRVSVPMSEL